MKKVLIVYATNSGSTFQMATLIGDVLSTKNTITIKKAEETHAIDLHAADLLLFGSPSWDVDGKEGSPLPTMQALFSRLEGEDLSAKFCAVFGPGDTSYTYFCGAVDRLELALTALGGKLLFPSLRVDGYYFAEADNRERVKQWTLQLQESSQR